jgi:NAD-dependent dihydropyrimidine dehydrogenase PreA subunit
MAYVIAEPCIDNMDQSCVAVCPVDCISADPSADRKFFIDPANCIDCGSCEGECPNQAIFRAEELPGEWAAFARIDATWYVNPEQARDEINGYYPIAAA